MIILCSQSVLCELIVVENSGTHYISLSLSTSASSSMS